MRDLTVIMTRGMQASGKSSWAIDFVQGHQDYKRCNRDSLRRMASNYTYDDLNEALVSRIEKETIRQIIDSGYHVVIDNMHLSDKTLEKTKQWITAYAKEKGITVSFVIRDFPITLAEALNRDAARTNPLGATVLKKTWRDYEVPLKQMLKQYAPKNNSCKEGPPAVLVDIDGTLADSTDRKIFDMRKLGQDILITPVHTVVTALAAMSYNILVVSGRSEDTRDATAQWLAQNKVPYQGLFMRRAKDHKVDTEVKQEIYTQQIQPFYNVQFVIDDRPSVCKMWQELGVFTFVVNQDAYAKNDF